MIAIITCPSCKLVDEIAEGAVSVFKSDLPAAGGKVLVKCPQCDAQFEVGFVDIVEDPLIAALIAWLESQPEHPVDPICACGHPGSRHLLTDQGDYTPCGYPLCLCEVFR